MPYLRIDPSLDMHYRIDDYAAPWRAHEAVQMIHGNAECGDAWYGWVPHFPMLGAADLVQLPKGQAFALIGGGQLYKLRVPLPDGAADPMWPVDLAAIGRALAARHPAHGTSNDRFR
jgi:hypothetical protein